MNLSSPRHAALEAIAEGLAPDPELTVSQWADARRVLSTKTSAEAGPWRTSRVPYMREIMDALSLSHPCTDGDFMKGTQIAGSESFFNAVGAVIDHSPCPLMYVMPTTDTAKRVSRLRLQPMFEETPSLLAKLAEAKSRDESNTVLLKVFAGGYLLVTGANSGPGLRMMPARVLLMDEIDAYPDDVDGEGDPCMVAEKRTDTFYRAKRFTCSSPKRKGTSRIYRRYMRGTRARYFVKCPSCNFEQWLRWPQMRWEMEKRRELSCHHCGITREVGDPSPSKCPSCKKSVEADWTRVVDSEDVAFAWYQCESCDARIDEHHKSKMLAEGRHIHELPGIGEVLADDSTHPHAIWAMVAGEVRRFLPSFNRPLSWHVSALYSPLGWFSWRKAVAQYLEAKRGGTEESSGETLMQVFENTVLGEPYEIEGEQPEQSMLKLRAEPYDLGTVPLGGLMLVAAVDVQGNRLEVKVKAYGRGQQSWLVDFQQLIYPFGAQKPTTEVWEQLIAIKKKEYAHESGKPITCAACAIDAGYLTQEVYDFTRKHARQHFFATKGVAERGKPILGRPSLVDIKFDGKFIKNGARVWPIGTDTAKELVYSRLALTTPGPGYMHFPRGLPDEYFEQLTAEKLVRRRIRGVAVNDWVKVRERNEALDLEVLCQAAAIYAGVNRRNWAQLERVLAPERTAEQSASENAPAATAESASEPPSGTALQRKTVITRPSKNWVKSF